MPVTDRDAIVLHGRAAFDHLDALADLAPDHALTLWAFRVQIAALFVLEGGSGSTDEAAQR
ncbi:hypothetical protein ACIU1J_32235 [Azospirillum doebereinerae]|uniref:hypothetical protein n=1 Tax=Azospirillum doebereinerae TaxID=92933 RepID=UPI001EE60896|nr:hypothetical protein [Azospirillum doebereinerae]MCG5238389.1 hypothetical protein [Azospirillum doebereinerae]